MVTTTTFLKESFEDAGFQETTVVSEELSDFQEQKQQDHEFNRTGFRTITTTTTKDQIQSYAASASIDLLGEQRSSEVSAVDNDHRGIETDEHKYLGEENAALAHEDRAPSLDHSDDALEPEFQASVILKEDEDGDYLDIRRNVGKTAEVPPAMTSSSSSSSDEGDEGKLHGAGARARVPIQPTVSAAQEEPSGDDGGFEEVKPKKKSLALTPPPTPSEPVTSSSPGKLSVRFIIVC